MRRKINALIFKLPSDFIQNCLNRLFRHTFNLRKQFIILVANHLVLSLFHSYGFLQICDSHFDTLGKKSLSFHVFLLFKSLNLNIYSTLRLNVFYVFSSHVNSWLFIDSFTLQQSWFHLILLNFHIGSSHSVMEILNWVLNFKNIRLHFFLFLKSS